MIISRKKYEALTQELDTLRKEKIDLLKVFEMYRKCNSKLENDIRILKNINSSFTDVIFPNTEEGRLGDTDTPTDLSDIWTL
jgi:hypothetical protein